MATTKITRIANAKQAKAVLGTMVKSDNEARAAFITYGAWLGLQTLAHGNKQPLELAESSGLAKYWVNALKRCVLKQDVEYRAKQDEAYQIAHAHAEHVAEMILDKKKDESEAAKQRRAEAKKKRDAEKARIAKLEKENAQFKAGGRKLPPKGAQVPSKGGAIVDPTGKVELTMDEDEHNAVLAYLKSLRKPAPKAVEKQTATA